MNKANINQEVLDLKDKLPYGSYKKICQKTGYTEVYISNVLCGRQEINDKNISIFEEAQKIVANAKKEFQKRVDKLNTLTENK